MIYDVSIIGLGYIGLPTAALISKKGTKVLGIDINESIVDKLNNGIVHIKEPGLADIVINSISNKKLTVTTKPESANTYLIVVPTPFKENYEPDISYVIDAVNSIIPILKEGDLIILESTSPVGTTQDISDLIFKKRIDLKKKIFIAYCPERVLPGNIMYELVNNDRVIGGINNESTKKAVNFYSKYVEGKLHETDSKTAEMCKIVENSSRDLQIAFANELSIICDKADVDVWRLINLANKHPRVNILQPGCGVGGHCIAVDPYFLISNYPNETKLIKASRNLNDYKSIWVFNKIKNEITNFENEFKVLPKVTVLGLSFKPDVDDIRESPALKITKMLLNDFSKDIFNIVEPNIDKINFIKLRSLNESIEDSNIIVGLVNHSEFKSLVIKKSQKFLDFCGMSVK